MDSSTLVEAEPEGTTEGRQGVYELRRALAISTAPDRCRRDSRGYHLRRLLLAADVAALIASFFLVELLGGLDGGPSSSLLGDLALFALAVPIWTLFAQAHNLYHVDSRRADHGAVEEFAPIVQMTTLWAWGILLGVSAPGLREIAVENLALFWILTIVALLAFRSGARRWARGRVWYLQNAIAVGSPAETSPVVERILRHPEYGIHVAASVDPTHYELGSPSPHVPAGLGPAPVIRGGIDVLELVQELDIDRVILSSSGLAAKERSELLSSLSDLEVHIDLVPNWSDVAGGRLDLHELEGVPLLTVPKTTLSSSAWFCKRSLDIVCSSLALVVLSPVLLLVGAAIKLTSEGPILYRQRRVGRDDCRFELYKFRTMYIDADARKDDVAALNFHGGGNVHGMFKIRRDPRVTSVGRVLRRASLDELPQLLNVLRGEMSLVGPRPLIETEDRQVEGRFRRRLTITPGLTGLWQVNGRSDIPFEQMVNLDYLYVTGWSLWRDIKLLLRTVQVVLKGRGAY